jgi:hypothetical protein
MIIGDYRSCRIGESLYLTYRKVLVSMMIKNFPKIISDILPERVSKSKTAFFKIIHWFEKFYPGEEELFLKDHKCDVCSCGHGNSHKNKNNK